MQMREVETLLVEQETAKENLTSSTANWKLPDMARDLERLSKIVWIGFDFFLHDRVHAFAKMTKSTSNSCVCVFYISRMNFFLQKN